MGKRKMSMGVKLIIGFIAVSLISLVVGVIALYNMNTINDFNDRLYKRELLGISYVKEANINLLYLVRNEKNFLLSVTMEQRNDHLMNLEKYKKAFQDNIDLATPLFFSDEGKAKLKEVNAAYNDWLKVHDQVIEIGRTEALNDKKQSVEISMGLAREKNNILDQQFDALTKIKEKNAKELADLGTQTFNTSLMIMIFIVLIGFGLGLGLGIALSRGISVPITNITNGLNSASSQIALASNQLSSSSQEIANGATEQASSIEETTSSMEELASMVKQNVTNAQEASNLAEKASAFSKDGYGQMEKMLESMTEINKSSDQIKKIIKVIDDIAFQTNILALNAAVEAARAGEAGMGFAVVADEVKNLANRSAEAAKETSSMIEDSMKRTEAGVQIASKLADVFKEILGAVQKVTEMSREVETASKQQDSGINQVNKAIVQFDEVVQANASAAEETASSAEELLVQVENLNDVVKKLVFLVTGKEAMLENARQERNHHTATVEVKKHVPVKSMQHQLAASSGIRKRESSPATGVKRREVSPEKLIPFEEDEDLKE
jgi:methyl-accepting chemotaxis protein